MRFIDRWSAGVALARLLAPHYKGEEVVVYALPRGGVSVAAPVALMLQVPLELIITRKIGHPRDPEYALGALTEDGDVLWDTLDREGVDEWWLASVIDVEKGEAIRRRNLYMNGKERVSARGKIAIIIDDGAATGLTMRAAIRSLRKDGPSKIVVALPVLSHQVGDVLRTEADEVVAAHEEFGEFKSVGRFYDNFAQVDDVEVMALLGRGGYCFPSPRQNTPVRKLRPAAEHLHRAHLA